MSYEVDGNILDFDTTEVPLLNVVLNFFQANSIDEIFVNYQK